MKPTTLLVLNLQAVLTSGLIQTQNATNLAFQMLDSTIARGQGCSMSSASTNFIELGIFQQALRESIPLTQDSDQKQRWSSCLEKGLRTSADILKNATEDVGYPLDRLSIGSNMIHQIAESEDEGLLGAVRALQESVAFQPKNRNGGLWYYANPDNLTFYRNLSYLDGMYSFAPFAVLSTLSSDPAIHPSGETASALDLQAMWKQIEILVSICQRPSGLLVHGYDAIKAHSWADPVTGASPIVWGRAQAWFTLGVLESLTLLQRHYLHWPGSVRSDIRVVFEEMKALFNDIVRAQLHAVEHSFRRTGVYGVWQVVDRPGDTGNFVEASSTAMTIYSLSKSSELGLLSPRLAEQAERTAKHMYEYVLENFLIRNDNGTLSYNGTSSVASLSGDVSYEYYVTRPIDLNSLIGTSAFVLASLQSSSD